MNVLHVVGGDLSKGAFKGAFWLHEGLSASGVNSKICGFIPSHQTSETISTLSTSRTSILVNSLLQRQDALWWLLYNRDRSAGFNAGLFGRKLDRYQDIKAFDIIHVHWGSNGVVNLPSIGRIDVPVVLTLRDMWFFTGGCHYSMSCERYTVGCGACPQLRSESNKDISFWLSRYKRKHLRNAKVNVVGISDWLTECAQKSSVFNDAKVHTIYNCVDTHEFAPFDKSLARDLLYIPQGRPIVLVGATNISSFYKGWEYFKEAVAKLGSEDVCIVTFGGARSIGELPSNINLKHLGYLQDELSLRLAYCAADVFVAPSVQEAFGKTLAESMACGTPVVCFDATGPASIVSHKVTGYKASPFSDEDLADGIKWVLDNRHSGSLRDACRERAINCFSKEVIAQQYINLYRSLL
ncbi:glycosyltransferase family 4 protein [Halorhodospira halochloris]|uniref:glycosyltransferase family 4 protein n=1 Tax=Halorhodospira halochloris TaxID=1052 RepID=UPI001EE865A8|nr:glycosyltransferase family 4 protein [Halorhodospira halochloris]MCG5548936.1 glycosyltransferase family 4 protein [Halorhodospira halochloris]